MWAVLQNAKVDLILDNIWNGPYEYENLHTDYSLMSQIVSPYLFGKKKYFNHIPFNNEAIPKIKKEYLTFWKAPEKQTKTKK